MSAIKAVLFDLDNTLYSELDYVGSGFEAVAGYLSSRYALQKDDITKRLFDMLAAKGRGRVFDELLRELDLYDADKVKLLLWIYRSHRPQLHLYDGALQVLGDLKRSGMNIGIITDGMASVQRNKIEALGLNDVFETVICTDELGREFWKPSTVPFKIALDLLRVRGDEAAYVGDDLSKDFIGPNALGMLTVMVKSDVMLNPVGDSPPKNAMPKFSVDRLEEVLSLGRGTSP